MLGAELYNRDAVLEAHAAHPAVAALVAHASSLIENAKWDRDELTLVIPRTEIRTAAEIVKGAGFHFLEDVTCVDWNPMEPRFQVTYHILSLSLKQRLRLASMVDGEDLEIASVVSVWPSANFYEREVFDLFGVRFGGHPNLRRIMMPDEWQGHPLRKDYPVEGYR